MGLRYRCPADAAGTCTRGDGPTQGGCKRSLDETPGGCGEGRGRMAVWSCWAFCCPFFSMDLCSLGDVHHCTVWHASETGSSETPPSKTVVGLLWKSLKGLPCTGRKVRGGVQTRILLSATWMNRLAKALPPYQRHDVLSSFTDPPLIVWQKLVKVSAKDLCSAA